MSSITPLPDYSENKILIIAYYWPPSGGSGVQRWLKFVKYLPQFGYTPYVFTPKNPSFAILDESLLKEVPPQAHVIRFPIWEPYQTFFSISRLFGQKKKSATPVHLVSSKNKSLFARISTWIRGNFLIPDPKIFWIKPSVRFLSNYITENKIKNIITTGPPHSIHLIGYRLKRKIPSLNWLADFRDPWTTWGLLDSLKVSFLARHLHRQLELKVLRLADRIITITPFYVRQFEVLANRPVELITNGFDEEDFRNLKYARQDMFLIRHVGIINEKCDPRPFMTALKEFMLAYPLFKNSIMIEFIGEVHPDFKLFVENDSVLTGISKFPGNIPHKELLKLYGESSLLLLILTGYKDAEGFMPGKLFEYLATGLPVLGIGPVMGDAADLLRKTKAGEMIDGSDKEKIKLSLKQLVDNWAHTHNPSINMQEERKNYSRRAITGKLIEFLR